MFLLRRLLAAMLAFLLLLASVLMVLLPLPSRAASYDAELSAALLTGPDLCAHADCRAVLPKAVRFTQRKGSPQYVEGYALAADGSEQLAGYVFLSTDVVDIPAYSGKPVVTLIGMDRSSSIRSRFCWRAFRNRPCSALSTSTRAGVPMAASRSAATQGWTPSVAPP
jgi:NosR/NirI family nitrous oxide reductase transcriptional regulator